MRADGWSGPRLRALVPTLLLLFVPLAVPAAAKGSFEDEKRIYRSYLRRPSLFMRTRGRTRFAYTGHVEALKILARSYGSPEEPKDRVPHLIASAAARGCRGAEHVPVYASWRKARRRAEDAWLWHQALQVELAHEGLDAVQEVVLRAPDVHLQVAAIRALAAWNRTEALALVPAIAAEAPARVDDRGMVFEALAAVVLARKLDTGREGWEEAVRAVIAPLDEKRLPLRSKLVIARHLKALFETDDVVGVNAAPWLRELAAKGGSGGAPDERYGPTFIGIRAEGSRVAYLIDASDSMLEPLTVDEKDQLKGPITGGTDDGLPWARIANRFDLAREFLKKSIRGLKPDQSFAVVLFGTEARLLRSTPGLVEADPKLVAEVVNELDRIEAGPVVENRPHGVLRGDTNLHGAFDRGFRVKAKGLEKPKKAYVEQRLLEQGCDTLFLLSDGVPTIDDYVRIDRRDPQDHAGDPEVNRTVENTPELSYYGPYVEWNGYLEDDIERMNLCRNVEIHCVGIGEADMKLLGRIAKLGLGETLWIGK